MSSKTDVELRNFFIFNSLYGPKEGEELKKILYYYPITDNADLQINNVGLVEGIIQFTGLGRPFVVTVEGNIASGKTTFLNHLRKRFDNICILAEPVDQWRNCNGHNLLQLFYQDPKKWCFSFQSYVQLTMLQHHILNTAQPIKFMERSLFSAHYCFVDKMKADGILPTASVSVLEEWFKWITRNTNILVDLIVYLRTTPEVAYNRLKKRDRSEEKTVPFEYLKELHNRHENWLYYKKSHPCSIPVIILNANLDEKNITKEYERFEDILFSEIHCLHSSKIKIID